MNLRVDRDRYLFLVSALAATSCTDRLQESISAAPGFRDPSSASASASSASASPASPQGPAASEAKSEASSARGATAPAQTQKSAPSTPTSNPPAAPASSLADETPTVACGNQNDDGAVDCSAVKGAKLPGPACEGLSGTCDLLAGGKIYRPRAARAAVACLNRMGARACEIGVRKRCYEEGVRASCPEAQFASACEAKMQQCRAAGQRVTYTKEECMKAASALTGGDRNWALGAMGPSSEGSCRLMFTVF
jgi:hypothetical protein